MPAVGTLGNAPLQDQDERAGAGLFVGGLGGTREHNLDAEVVPCAGDRGTSRP